jgi:hypothetical protein
MLNAFNILDCADSASAPPNLHWLDLAHDGKDAVSFLNMIEHF